MNITLILTGDVFSVLNSADSLSVLRSMIEAERRENQNSETSFALKAGISVTVLVQEYIECGVECDDIDPVERRHYLRIPRGAMPDEFAAEDVNTAEVPHENLGPQL